MNVEVDPEEVSISRTSSDESIDELPEIMPLTIEDKTVNTQGIALSVNIDGKKYNNSMFQKKNCMMKRGSYKGVEMPYIINDVYINEDNDGYFYDISNTNDLRKISTDKDIRVTFDTWNLYQPSTGTYVDISELYAHCDYRKIIYKCRLLISITASVTLPNNLLTGPVFRIGKIRGIYFNEDDGDVFLIVYSKINMI